MSVDDASPAEAGASSRPPEDEDQLSHLIPALSKMLAKATRASDRLPGLESQVSILRRVVDVGPLPPAHLAQELFLSRPHVSMLLRDLESDGLVTREPSERDGRSVLVSPTEYGRDVLQQVRQGRREVLARALQLFDDAERECIREALPLLQRLLEELGAAAQSRQEHEDGALPPSSAEERASRAPA